MSVLHYRYSGNIIDINECNYGTAKLNIKVNNNSTAKFGLTTDSNATEYCKVKFKIGTNTAYLGRSMTTSYISGNSTNYFNSSSTNRSISVSTSSDYSTSSTTREYNINTSSMNTNTYMYTQVTSTQQVETSSNTEQIWTNSATFTRNAGSYSGTSAVRPNNTSNAYGTTVYSYQQELVQTNSSTGWTNTGTGVFTTFTRRVWGDTFTTWNGNTYWDITTASISRLLTSSSTGAINVNNGYLVGTYNYDPGTAAVWNGNSYYNRSRTATEWVQYGSTSIGEARTALSSVQSNAQPSGYAVNNGVVYDTYTVAGGDGVKTYYRTTSNKWSKVNATASQQVVKYSNKSSSMNCSGTSRTVSEYTNGWKASTSIKFTSSSKYSYRTITSKIIKSVAAEIYNKTGAAVTKSGGVATLQVKCKTTASASTTAAFGTSGTASNQTQKGSSYTKTSSHVRTQLKSWKLKTGAGSHTKTTSYWTSAENYTFNNSGTVGYYTYTTNYSMTVSHSWGQSEYSSTKRWSAWASSYYRESYYSYALTYSYQGSSSYRQSYYSYSTKYNYSASTSEIYTQNYYSTRTNRYYSTASSTGTTYYTSATRSTTYVSETMHNCNL